MDAIYARQSIDKADSISIESQVEFCSYETRGQPYRVFQDQGFSGKNTNRPGFQDMLRHIRKGEIQRVICYRLDRCSRSILDFTKLMEELQQYQVEFISCTEKFDTSTPMGRAMLNICIVFAQLERETIQQRIYDAYHARNKRGFYMGGRIPLGFTLVPHTIEGKKTARYAVQETEAGILKQIFSVYEKPETSLADVITALRQAGIPHPRKSDGQWVRSHIGRLIHNPIYVQADESVYQYYQEKGVIIRHDVSDFLGSNGCYLYTSGQGKELILAPHPGIISAKQWLRCQRKNFHCETSNQRKASSTWLAGKLKCACCGYALTVRSYSRKDGSKRRYLLCSRQKEFGCPPDRKPELQELEDQILLQMQEKWKQLHLTKMVSIEDSLLETWPLLNLDEKKSVTDLMIQRISVEGCTVRIYWRI